MPKFIVYACPTGDLAAQIQRFYDESLVRFGPNAAHACMLHCTLVGFFEDTVGSVPLYTRVLTRAYNRRLKTDQSGQTKAAVTVKGFAFRPDWHGLELESAWLKQLMVDFTCSAHSPTRKGALRLKDWLQVSLADEFEPEQAKPLANLATALIDPTASVNWELRYYQQSLNNRWICHQVWPIP